MQLSINYFSAKTVMRTYVKQGRIWRKLTRDRRHMHPCLSTLAQSFWQDKCEHSSSSKSGAIDPDILHSGVCLPDTLQVLGLRKLATGTGPINASERPTVSSVESSKSDFTRLRPGFSFNEYAPRIEEEGAKHYEEAVKRMRFVAGRTLPAPAKDLEGSV